MWQKQQIKAAMVHKKTLFVFTNRDILGHGERDGGRQVGGLDEVVHVFDGKRDVDGLLQVYRHRLFLVVRVRTLLPSDRV